jgi:threonine dehydratase
VATADAVTPDRLRDARAALAPVVRPTPSVHSHSLSTRFGREVWLKPEHLQRTGSFKVRGAYVMQSRLGRGASVVAASAGNHAQGVALAAGLLGQHATIFMPVGASLPKVQATRAYGAEVVLAGDTVDDCLLLARARAADTGATFVPPFDHPDVVCGQATIGAELVDEVPGLANVVVAIGGGGLCGGIAAALALSAPEVRVVGVAAEGAASIVASLAAGHPVPVEPHTLADGIALGAPSELTLGLIARHVDEVVTVPDGAISQAMLLLVERAKGVVEPAGAAPLAALLGEVGLADGPTAVVLGGGNVDPLLLTKLVEHGLSVAGRYLAMQVVMDDRPGTLAALTARVAELGLNVLDVEHHRSGRRLPVGAVEVELTVETRDHEHQREVLEQLTAAGFRVEPVE